MRPSQSRQRRSDSKPHRGSSRLRIQRYVPESAPAVGDRVAVRAINQALNRALDDRLLTAVYALWWVSPLPICHCCQLASWPSQVESWQSPRQPKDCLCQRLAVGTIPEVATDTEGSARRCRRRRTVRSLPTSRLGSPGPSVVFLQSGASRHPTPLTRLHGTRSRQSGPCQRRLMMRFSGE